MYKLCINNGLVIDPEKRIAFPGSVGIENGKIAEISASPLQAEEVLDAGGTVGSKFRDGVHLNEAGYRIWLAALLRAMGS